MVTAQSGYPEVTKRNYPEATKRNPSPVTEGNQNVPYYPLTMVSPPVNFASCSVAPSTYSVQHLFSPPSTQYLTSKYTGYSITPPRGVAVQPNHAIIPQPATCGLQGNGALLSPIPNFPLDINFGSPIEEAAVSSALLQHPLLQDTIPMKVTNFNQAQDNSTVLKPYMNYADYPTNCMGALQPPIYLGTTSNLSAFPYTRQMMLPDGKTQNFYLQKTSLQSTSFTRPHTTLVKPLPPIQSLSSSLQPFTPAQFSTLPFVQSLTPSLQSFSPAQLSALPTRMMYTPIPVIESSRPMSAPKNDAQTKVSRIDIPKTKPSEVETKSNFLPPMTKPEELHSKLKVAVLPTPGNKISPSQSKKSGKKAEKVVIRPCGPLVDMNARIYIKKDLGQPASSNTPKGRKHGCGAEPNIDSSTEHVDTGAMIMTGPSPQYLGAYRVPKCSHSMDENVNTPDAIPSYNMSATAFASSMQGVIQSCPLGDQLSSMQGVIHSCPPGDQLSSETPNLPFYIDSSSEKISWPDFGLGTNNSIRKKLRLTPAKDDKLPSDK